jgi:hypothetical protein
MKLLAKGKYIELSIYTPKKEKTTLTIICRYKQGLTWNHSPMVR